jgi:prolyl oligopeptidase
MTKLIELAPHSQIELVTDVLHGIPIEDPYRWLEDQDSPRTRAWIAEQTRYARNYLDAIPGRERIRRRVQEFLAVETYDSLQKAGDRYFFRKRLPNQEQPCIYVRDSAGGDDRLLMDPTERGTGPYTAIKPRQVSPDGRLLLYEVKEGGERTGTFELLDITTRNRLPDSLPRGYLRGFAFEPDCKSFNYVHEATDAKRPYFRAAYRHVLGTPPQEDEEIFVAGEDNKMRLSVFSEDARLVFLVYRFLEKTLTDIYLKPFEGAGAPEHIFRGVDYSIALRMVANRIFAITDRDAPNRRVVEIQLRDDGRHEWTTIVRETSARIDAWHIARDRIFVSYLEGLIPRIRIFGLSGEPLGEIPISADETLRIVGASSQGDELFCTAQSFTEPPHLSRYSVATGENTPWDGQNVPFDHASFAHCQVRYTSRDGTSIPMYLVGRQDVLAKGGNPTILTSYGGHGKSVTPEFSVFVLFLMERGCLFALPNIRGGSEFGVEWHRAAQRHYRQTAYDDFLSAAEWLQNSGRTSPGKLAIFGGSNSGLLVGAALTQRPELFRAALSIVPMLDMLRYHLFDNAHIWNKEYGTADDPEDFVVLHTYSPYHRVQDGVAYPATMIVSGDADRNCNPLHARKMTARLQTANVSAYPILLDYSPFRGHSPVLPLSQRVEALTDRLAFLADQLELSV